MIGGTHIQTHRLIGGIYRYAVEMGSSATIYVPSFIKAGSGIQKLIVGIHRHTDGKVISLYFQNMKSRLKKIR
jgi:hypothetical protein